MDLGAEFIGAEKEGEKIAVEIKSFIGKSEITDFYEALGKFRYYKYVLDQNMPERILFWRYQRIFTLPFLKRKRSIKQ
ncbi:MAG: element excision factor XisH family protein [Bacteroidota bacterium]